MNEFTETIGQDELDRMVDGELTDEEQRLLLSRVEASPDEWKRLALAYVEAQTWQNTFRQTVPDASTVPSPSSVDMDTRPQNADSSERDRKLVPLLMTVTVAVLLLSVGVGLGSWLSDRGATSGEGEFAGVDEPTPSVEAVDPEAVPTFETVVVNDEPAPDGPEVVNPSVVQFVVHDGRSDDAQLVSVPFRDESVPLDEVFNTAETSVPADLRDVLQKTGHEIVEEQGFLPVALPDGRQVVFPVNQVRVRNMARIYQ